MLPPDSVLSSPPYPLSIPHPPRYTPFPSLPLNPIVYLPAPSRPAPALDLFPHHFRILMFIPGCPADAPTTHLVGRTPPATHLVGRVPLQLITSAGRPLQPISSAGRLLLPIPSTRHPIQPLLSAGCPTMCSWLLTVRLTHFHAF